MDGLSETGQGAATSFKRIKMPKFVRPALAAIALFALPAAGFAAEFNDKQRDEIGTIVREYLMANPEVLLDVSKALEAKQQEEEEKTRTVGVADNKDEIFRSEHDYVGGNPKGDVTMVEFFDYNCGWCKKGMTEVVALLEEDKGLRLVMKEFPIFGEDSEYAARAALAARKQGKYWELHLAMLGHDGKVTKESVDEIAAAQGLDMAQLKTDMDSEEIAGVVLRNQELAQKLAINGTPAFIIDDKVVPGYLPKVGLQVKIQEVRANGGCKVC
jgi:protein-disulfide isomerase